MVRQPNPPDPSSPGGTPLRGLCIWNTREAASAASLTSPLARLGAKVIAQPTIAFDAPESWAPFDDALRRLTPDTWIVFTSATAVRFVFRRLVDLGRSPKELAACPIAAVGRGTGGALAVLGLPPAVVPESQQQEGLLEALAPRLGAGNRVWLPRAEKARPLLERGLRDAGADVTVSPVYRTVLPPEGLGAALEALLGGEIDWVLFTSSSTVDHLIEMLPDGEAQAALRNGPRIACLGAVTAGTARERGLKVAVVPDRQDMEGLVAAVADCVTGERGNNLP